MSSKLVLVMPTLWWSVRIITVADKCPLCLIVMTWAWLDNKNRDEPKTQLISKETRMDLNSFNDPSQNLDTLIIYTDDLSSLDRNKFFCVQNALLSS